MNSKQQETNLKHDSMLYREYTEFMKNGATNMQALVQVAITNELEVITVFDALVRAEHRDLPGASVGD